MREAKVDKIQLIKTKNISKKNCFNNGDAVTYCGDGMIWDREEGKL